jgi:Concanavalin A-like lectin/glucanases superfamily
VRRRLALACVALGGGLLAACWLTSSFDGLTAPVDDGGVTGADGTPSVDAPGGGDSNASDGGAEGSVDGQADVAVTDALAEAFPSDAGCLADSYAASVVADKPVAYWHLGEPAGATVAKDATGHYDGTYQPGVTAGVPGVFPGDTAALFDGLTGMILVGPNPAFNGKTPFTVEAWVFPNKIDGSFRGILSNESSTAANRSGFLLYAHLGATNDFGFERWANQMSNPTAFHTAALGAWSHVAGTFDGTTLDLFVNGAKVDEDVVSIVSIPGTYTFAIGALLSGTQSSAFAGKIDEVAAYDHPVDPRCLLAHYHLGLGQAP